MPRSISHDKLNPMLACIIARVLSLVLSRASRPLCTDHAGQDVVVKEELWELNNCVRIGCLLLLASYRMYHGNPRIFEIAATGTYTGSIASTITEASTKNEMRAARLLLLSLPIALTILLITAYVLTGNAILLTPGAIAALSLSSISGYYFSNREKK